MNDFIRDIQFDAMQKFANAIGLTPNATKRYMAIAMGNSSSSTAKVSHLTKVCIGESERERNRNLYSQCKDKNDIKDKQKTQIGMENYNSNDGLSVSVLKNLSSHINFNTPRSQFDYYSKHNASPEILRYVNLQGKAFGEMAMENIAREFFHLEKPPTSTKSYDHTKNSYKIEQKSARYHANGTDWKWQHIEMKHNWDALMVTGLDFNCIKYYIAKRSIIEKLIEDNIIIGQGAKNSEGIAQPQQAYWFSRSDFRKKNVNFTDYFTEIKSERDLINYLNSI